MIVLTPPRVGGTLAAGDAGVGKSSLLVRLTDQRFLANPDPTVRVVSVPVRPYH